MVKISTAIIKTINEYLLEAEKICHLDKVILFGSYANGNVINSSDIDIAIFSKQITENNRLDVMTQLIAKTGKFKHDIQPMAFTFDDFLSNENDFITNEIKGKGIELKS